jgi:hypothetical protein
VLKTSRDGCVPNSTFILAVKESADYLFLTMNEIKNPSPKPSVPMPNLGKEGAIPSAPREIGGRKGPEPTRYGDWEHNGKCVDF